MKTNARPILRTLAIAAVFSLSAPAAVAATDIFLKIVGVDGESTDDKHRGAIEVLSFAWDFAPKSGDLVGRTSKVCAHDLVITKKFDKASPVFIANAIQGTVIPKATMTMRKAGEGQQDFLTFELINVVVSSVSSAATTGVGLSEQVTFNASSATITYKPQDDKGGLGPAIVAPVARTC